MASTQQTKYCGVTAPLSVAEPTSIDLELTKKLEEAMKPHGVFESDEELAKRFVMLFKAILFC